MGLVAERWTDDRMDDLKSQVEGVDRRMEQGFRDLRVEMNERFDRLEARFDKLVYALIGLSASMFAAMMGLIAAVILSL